MTPQYHKHLWFQCVCREAVRFYRIKDLKTNIIHDSSRVCVGEWEKKKSKKSRAAPPVLGKFHHVGHHVGGRVLPNRCSYARLYQVLNIVQKTVGRTDNYCMFNIRGGSMMTHRHLYSDFLSQFTHMTHNYGLILQPGRLFLFPLNFAPWTR